MRQKCKKLLLQSGARSYDRSKINQILKKLIALSKARNILLYIPMEHEVDISALFKTLRRKVNLFVPFMQGQSFKVVKYRLPLQQKRFGIKEPKNSRFQRNIDLAIVPVIGVDGNFRRVGFGKGMYDRYFATVPKRPLTVFVQQKACITNKQVTDRYDVLGDLLITPQKIIIRGDSDVGRIIGRKLCRHYKWRCRVFRSKKDRKR
ncbi:5-formyltetrahydrofolate cyclo-ligase [Nitratiruptor sp. YY09-18]|uniref:5-formyltetrahydrofolate cyclo-ligase n=1 Tax=Nitratiruptor sp. YY09-18 TaxID=2724901 RepID=UPI001915B830|nr:5-formyltetrahydrofolate cyclo-ligase [Nitratiruptor sp. YY09-18]